MRTESDELVRATLVTRLASNFAADPAARKALQDISTTDASQLVRQVARRALLGEADWHEYVLDTVRDRELSARQRFEPIRYLLNQTLEVKDGKALAWRTLDEFDAAQGETAAGILERALERLRTEWTTVDPAERERVEVDLASAHLVLEERGFDAPERVDVPGGLGVTVYRVVQEALTNARRHGTPGPVTVGLRWEPRRLRVEVVSPGAPSSFRPGHGITGMRERVAMYGGTLDVGPRSGSWQVLAELPLDGEAAA